MTMLPNIMSIYTESFNMIVQCKAKYAAYIYILIIRCCIIQYARIVIRKITYLV